jgi:chromate transporter
VTGEPTPATGSVTIRPVATVWEVAALFLRLGATAFGGPAAHIALVQDEVVRRRKWFNDEEFLDLLSAANLIPGPNSTELVIHIGHRVAGWPGLVAAGSCFIVPAALMVTLIAWAYVSFGALPPVEGILYGVKPVVIAVVLQALWKLGASCLKSRFLVIAGMIDVALAALGVHELVVLFGTGVVLALARSVRGRPMVSMLMIAWPAVGPGAPAAAAVPFGLAPLFWSFLKIGSVLFGSGYVLLAFLRSEFVERYGWLTEQQLLDAVAVGQVTPGPVFTAATFIGYVLGGLSGAVVSTVGIFLPAFLFVALSLPLVSRLRRSVAAGAFLDGVNVASLALMGVVTSQLARAALVDGVTVALAVGSAMLLVRFTVNATWLVLAGAALGLIRVLVFVG